MKNSIELYQTDQYQSLVEDCRAIIVEGVYRARQEVIDMHQELGDRIINDELYKKYSHHGLVEKLANDVGKSTRTIWYAVQFSEKLKIPNSEVCMAVQSSKNISWNKIKTEYLPEPKENKIVLPIPKGKYGLVVIDPPWNYGTDFDVRDRRSASTYNELSQEELKKIEIPSSANSVLWLWTTHKFLWDAKELLEHSEVKPRRFELKSRYDYCKVMAHITNEMPDPSKI